MIRPARPQDAEDIADIWNAIIRDTTITFTTAQKEADAIASDIARGAPVFVAATGAGRVDGFVTAGQFRGGPGYARTWEHSVHVRDGARGMGMGRALMATLEERLRRDGAHSLFAGVSGENRDGVAFHTALGFEMRARLPQVGWKFDRWHDLVLMQKFL